MSLISLAEKSPKDFVSYSVEQIVAICGDGKLRDDSECSEQFRDFVALQENEKLAEYARYCLENKFDKNGFVLQDVVNEIGRRLGFQVENGRYVGTSNSVGFDGLWSKGSDQIVVEVKTTDAYRINLDTIVGYGTKAKEASGSDDDKYTALVVVGRQDTGDFEAQIRGSRHAWSVRLVSVDALLKLLFVNEQLEDQLLNEKIQTILRPFEYTRVDNIVDLVFETQQETDLKAQTLSELEDHGTSVKTSPKMEFTPTAQLDAKRNVLVTGFFEDRELVPVQETKTNYGDAANILHVTCAMSKRYQREYQPYWYGLQPAWLEFMKEGQEGYFILGCMDRDEAYALPVELVVEHLDALNMTTRGDRSYWHIVLSLDGQDLMWNLTKIGKKIDLSPYAFSVITANSS